VPLRRFVLIVLSIAGVLALASVLYLAFGNLSRHKGRIEALVTQKTGRPFAIDGAFAIEVLPSVSVRAERVRLGNAKWGSAPQMVEVGRFSTEIGLWSLVSGPIDVRSLELGDVSVLLEKGKDGKGNWALGEGKPEEPRREVDSLDPGLTEVPAVIRKGALSSVRVTYREPGKEDRVALLETLTIAPGSADLLAISGSGRVDKYATTLKGELGPLDALFSGRNIRVALEAGVEKLRSNLAGQMQAQQQRRALEIEFQNLRRQPGGTSPEAFARGERMQELSRILKSGDGASVSPEAIAAQKGRLATAEADLEKAAKAADDAAQAFQRIAQSVTGLRPDGSAVREPSVMIARGLEDRNRRQKAGLPEPENNFSSSSTVTGGEQSFRGPDGEMGNRIAALVAERMRAGEEAIVSALRRRMAEDEKNMKERLKSLER
jgi:hypothetical protein